MLMHEEDSAKFQHVRMCPLHVSYTYAYTYCGKIGLSNSLREEPKKLQVVPYITYVKVG